MLTTKKRKAGEETIPCEHQLVWNKRKKDGNCWVLNKEKSFTGHSPFYNAEQKATRMELTHDKEFIKHVTVEPETTGKKAVKNAIGGESGRLDGSVNEHTARRARNDIMRYHDHDYEEDWSKLEGWKNEYEEKNPRSRCVFQDNPLSRGIHMYVLGPKVCTYWVPRWPQRLGPV